nr:MAG TPA: hypothetical protein [Caudoviricetes sp.]
MNSCAKIYAIAYPTAYPTEYPTFLEGVLRLCWVGTFLGCFLPLKRWL